MPDYYAILWRALRKGDFASVQWRESVFDQTRQMLRNQLRNTRPPLSNTEIRLHADALEAAIKAIQSELAQDAATERVETDRSRSDGERSAEAAALRETGSKARARGSTTLISVVLAVVVAAVAAGGYAYMASRHSGSPPQTTIEPRGSQSPPAASKIEAAKEPSATLRRPAKGQHKLAAIPPDGDLPPGVDGGSTDADVPFFFRRQPVFYRTTHPVGSIIIDKQQHFLYLIQPNQVALRYGIAVGKSCAGAAGLHKVTSKVEWPEWLPPADMVERKLAPAGVMKGGPGNPLGARLIGLDDGSMRIHGTNAPKTIGSSLNSGCIRLVNDDVADLYNRVALGARVVFGD